MAELTIRQLQYFVAVLDHGSVTAAASASHISQAAASMSIAQLERAVGIDLLVRTKAKKVVATAAGVELAARARHILTQIGELEGAVAGGFHDMRGPLRVGCSPSLSPLIIPGLVAHFVERYPDVDVTFHEGAAEDMQRGVLDGWLDVTFVYSLQADETMELVEVAAVRPRLMLAADHPMARRPTVSFADVRDEWAILFDVPPTIERVSAIMRASGVEPRLRWCSSNMETIRSLVAQGLGFSFVNTWPATDITFDRGRVAYVPVSDVLPRNAIVGVLPPGVRPPRRVIEAIRFQQEAAARIDPDRCGRPPDRP